MRRTGFYNPSAEPKNPLFPKRKGANAFRVAARQDIVVVGRHSKGRKRGRTSCLQSQKLSVKVNQAHGGGAAGKIPKTFGMRFAHNRLLPWFDLTLQICQDSDSQAYPSSVVRGPSHDHCKRAGTADDIDEGEKAVNSPVKARVQPIKRNAVMRIKQRFGFVPNDFIGGLTLSVCHVEPFWVVPVSAAEVLGSELAVIDFSFAVRPWSVPCDGFDWVGAVILSQADPAANWGGL